MAQTNSTLGPTALIDAQDADTGYARLVSVYGVPPTTTLQFAPGCIAVDRLNNTVYQNRGTAAAPKWVQSLAKWFTTATDTNGTTAVNIFGTGGAPCALTITSVTSTALDTTAGNITVQQAANTVVTIAKGTTAGALVGGVTLANATYAAADVATVLSSSAGNSRVMITWQLA